MTKNDIRGLIAPITQRQFQTFALSLERGPNFDSSQIFRAYQTRLGTACGCILFDPKQEIYTIIALRRRVDHRWVKVDSNGCWANPEAALDHLSICMRTGDVPEKLPPGARRRPMLLDTGARETCQDFKTLTETVSHFPALMAVGECYLALPKPDDNFVSDLQTTNFAARLFELYLLACFREQGILVRQDQTSPDFWIEKNGTACWIEAVTANSNMPISDKFEDWTKAPRDVIQRFTGDAAERFAKTLRSKIQHNYHELDHVKDQPFALAIADFHASGSMVWSSEALPTYLYGFRPAVVEEGTQLRAITKPVNTLTGKDKIPAGLFRDPNNSHVSAVIFSNAATMAKFNRMGFLAGWRPPGLSMIRIGKIYDRTPGALEAIPFALSVVSNDYHALWPYGEAWCQELEIYHNPLATHPIPISLVPGATHWFEDNEDLESKSMWDNSVMTSITQVNRSVATIPNDSVQYEVKHWPPKQKDE